MIFTLTHKSESSVQDIKDELLALRNQWLATLPQAASLQLGIDDKPSALALEMRRLLAQLIARQAKLTT